MLPVYNGQNNIYKCLKSLSKQKITPHEIIVINDCSTDNTFRLITHFNEYYNDSEKIPLKIFNNEERKGAAWCRNQGNFYASGDVIAVCDADWYSEERSVAIDEFFNEKKEMSLFYSGLECQSSLNPNERWAVEAFEWDFNSKCPISHPTIAYRKELANEIKYHEESLETDLYEFFLLDAHKKGYLFSGCQNPLMIKVEGDTIRDRSDARKLKISKYKEYGIEVDM